MHSKKAIIISTLVSIFSFVANFSVFVLGYRYLAFPFLSEEQRVINADFIMNIIVGAFALLAILLGFTVYWVFRTSSHYQVK